MKERNSVDENVVGSKWLLPLAFVVISFVGYFGFAFMQGNYFDALSIPLIIIFIWVGVVKQKFALGISLIAFFMLLAIPAMSAGIMSWHILNPILMMVVIATLSMGAYRLPLRKTIAMFVFFFLSVLLMYAFDFLATDTFVILVVAGSGTLLGSYLFADKLAVSQG